MKKIFVFLFSLFLLFSISFEANASKIKNPKIIEKNMEVFKKKLEKEENGKMYIKKLDEKLLKMDKQNLEKLSKNLERYLKTYKGEYFNLLKYMKFKIDYDLVKGNFGEEVLKDRNLENYKIDEIGVEFTYPKNQEIEINYEIEESNIILKKEEKKDKKGRLEINNNYYEQEKLKKYLGDEFYIEILYLDKKLLKEKFNIDLSLNLGDYLRTSKKINFYNIEAEGKVEKIIFGGKNAYKILYLEKGKTLNHILYIIESKDFEGGYFIDIKFGEKALDNVNNIIDSIKFFKPKINKKLYEEKVLDKKRIKNLEKIHLSLGIYYSDNGKYPEKLEYLSSGDFLDKKIPKDPKDGQIINGCKFGYNYEKISNDSFRLSTCMESEDGKKQAKNDGGIYEDKYEIFSK